jgi:carboxymethylenebutenolidase
MSLNEKLSTTVSDKWNAYVNNANSDMGVVLLHEIWGFTDYIKSVADQLGLRGCSAAAIDLFKGKKPNTIEEGSKIRNSLRREEDILGGIKAGIQLLKNRGVKRIGTFGFCMGGGFALLGACNIGEISFCVNFYGGIDDPEEIEKLKGPMILILASEDPRLNNWAFTRLLPSGAKYNKRIEVQLYPKVKHAFHRRGGENYNEEAANDAWERAIVFLERTRKKP